MIHKLTTALRRHKARQRRRNVAATYAALHPSDRRFVLATLKHWNRHPRRWWWWRETTDHISIID